MNLDAIGDVIPKVMNPADLREWIALVKERDISHIEAEEVGRCWPGEVMASMYSVDASGMSMPCMNYEAMMKRLEAEDLDGYMLRWNLCAPIGLKSEIAETGNVSTETLRDLDPLSDIRFFSIIEEQSPMQVIVLYKRPWVEPYRHNGFPVEFRVFVEGKNVVGVSNYYPQISLPEKYEDIAEKCMEMTEVITDARPTDGFTADWMLTSEKELKLIECGPMHSESGGSHPCCFRPGEVEGVKLSPLVE